jgi:hypothetical protein
VCKDESDFGSSSGRVKIFYMPTIADGLTEILEGSEFTIFSKLFLEKQQPEKVNWWALDKSCYCLIPHVSIGRLAGVIVGVSLGVSYDFFEY